METLATAKSLAFEMPIKQLFLGTDEPLVVNEVIAETSNDENTLIIHDAAIANIFAQEFNARWLGQTTNTPTVRELKGFETTIFPNPVQGHFFVELEETYANQSLLIKITNATGQLIHQRRTQQTSLIRFDESVLTENGLYILTIQNQQGEIISTKKILK